MSACAELIGKPYVLGADGSDGSIDCIHLVYAALTDLGVPTPPFKQSWYTSSWKVIARDLLLWGKRVPEAAYDGDVILLRQDRKAFAVAWNQGALYINEQLGKVAWCKIKALPAHYVFRCSRLSAT